MCAYKQFHSKRVTFSVCKTRGHNTLFPQLVRNFLMTGNRNWRRWMDHTFRNILLNAASWATCLPLQLALTAASMAYLHLRVNWDITVQESCLHFTRIQGLKATLPASWFGTECTKYQANKFVRIGETINQHVYTIRVQIKFVVEWLIFLLRIREVHCSDLGLGIDVLNQVVYAFLHSVRKY
jgi:hypothetical protein